ncbi:MAG: hypothetical protein DMF05_06300, partial [Verrucomicrobia bacterium]
SDKGPASHSPITVQIDKRLGNEQVRQKRRIDERDVQPVGCIKGTMSRHALPHGGSLLHPVRSPHFEVALILVRLDHVA